MFNLIDSVDPVNSDNNTLKYSPKLKRFINKHKPNNKKKNKKNKKKGD